MEKRFNWNFYWKDGSTYISNTLTDRTREEAFELATQLGWKPLCWHKPSTWQNRSLAWACN